MGRIIRTEDNADEFEEFVSLADTPTTTPAEVREAVAWAERMLERTLLDHPEDDKHLRTLLAELARLTCAVGEAEKRNVVLALKGLTSRVDFALAQNQWPDADDLETLEQVAAWWTDCRARTALNPSKEA